MMLTNPAVESDRASTDHPGSEDYPVLEFGGGINLIMPPHKIPDGEVRNLLNMYYPRETFIPRTRPGCSVLASTPSAMQITAIHVFRPSESTSYVCFTAINSTVMELYYQSGTSAPVLINGDLGSIAVVPSMATMNGCLLVTLPGIGIYEWQGYTATNPAAGHGTVDAVFADEPTVGDTLTVGTETWTWITDGTTAAPYEVEVGNGANEAAANLAAAIDRDSSIIEASAVTDTTTISARRIGTAGNLAISKVDAATDITLSAATLTGGVNGLHLDLINTYTAPQPGFMIVDQNQRLVASGDPTYPDRVFFSAPADHWQWATGIYGAGETFDLGYKDGTDIVAIHPMLGNLVAHKSGQGRDIWRINTMDPDPSTWAASRKRFFANTSALNQRVVTGVTDKQLFLDTRGFSTLSGTDTYDEILVGAAGMKLGNKLSSPNVDNSFFVTNPDETYTMVFTNAGTTAWVFHYGSGRWARWEFRLDSYITCGCYRDSDQTVLLATYAGDILKLDPSIATDDGAIFPSEVQSKALGGGSLRSLLVTQTLLDYEYILAGEGAVSLFISNESTPSQPLFNFTLIDAALLLSGTYATTTHVDDSTELVQASAYGRQNSFEQGGGELVSMRVRLYSGAFALHGAMLRVDYHGRVAQ